MGDIAKLKRDREQLLIRAQRAEAKLDSMAKTRDQFHKLLDTTIMAFSQGGIPHRQPGSVFQGITFVIAYYDIPQQIERTLISCSPKYQSAPQEQIEVIIADNGSSLPLPPGLQEKFPFVSRVLRTEGRPSPVFALNEAISHARFPTVAIMIDGAHILSPGIFRNVREMVEKFERPVINVPQYLLGAVSQNLNSPPDAFECEARDLELLNWPNNGYALFDYAVRAGEAPDRTMFQVVESNCLITTKSVLDSCGSFDEHFDEPGGGLANLDLFARLANHPENSLITLPGEGSFHQNHDGTTTGKDPEARRILVEGFMKRYEVLTGFPNVLNARSPFVYGEVRRAAQSVPTISQEYGRVKRRLLQQLAEIYALRAQAGVKAGNDPVLAFGIKPTERYAFNPLPPLCLLESEPRFHCAGQEDLQYLSCLRRLHNASCPELYLEIGVDTGRSLSLSRCRSIGVDPDFNVSAQIPVFSKLFRMTSDSFFENEMRCKNQFGPGVDFTYIDGMHLAEYALRDFINVEKWSKPNSIVVIDDVLPEQMPMAMREREYNSWCGDIYKIIPILRDYRPDLEIDVFEAFTGPYRKGLAVVRNLDPGNTVLSDHYSKIERDILGDTWAIESISQLEEMVGISPWQKFDALLQELSCPAGQTVAQTAAQ